MNYIMLDLEYNQSFDFEDGKDYRPDEACPFEIIQMGAVKLDSKYEYVESFTALIKPKIYPRLHPYVEKITGISQPDLEQGLDFPLAILRFMEFVGREKFVFCVWGANDIKELWKNMLYYSIKFNYKRLKFINVQFYATKHLRSSPNMSIGLKNAVINFDIEMDRPFHNALNDAYYTGKILQHIPKQRFAIQSFNLNKIPKSSGKLEITNYTKLYSTVEKELGRKLSAKEKRVYKAVYNMGKNAQFDLLKKN